jgi:Ca2+/Na+ antiporter|tara:strand:+ start:313 stop:768 length:456 start_codon:yes stop_codon:yes gene_type:complete
MTILRSFLITLLVAIAFAFGLRNIIGFWETLALAIVIQFIIAFVYSSFKISRVDNLTQEFEGELQQLLDLSEVTIACPCGNYTFTENVFLNMENTYTCEKCNNDFRIEVSITPTLLTQPVNVNQAFAELTKEEEVDDDIKITSSYSQGTEL